ncbi:MAG TPA: YitT family protein, partial [Anaerolineaceae bacterium]|nr:YitT family protein [Anaerolineaceae bacterium]
MAERTVFNRNIRESLRLDRSFLKDIFFIFLGALVQALAMRMFLIPALLVSGGVSGLAQIINYYTNWPIGVMVI